MVPRERDKPSPPSEGVPGRRNVPQIKDIEILTDIETVRALALTERLAMLGRLTEEPKTGAMVAAELGIPVNRAHYHLQRLLKFGLIHEVGRGRKRWKEERFFIASARHFLVDPKLGLRDPEMLAVFHHSLESLFLEWRRAQILNIDLAEVARRIVHDCLRIKPGETVLVMFGRYGLDLGETILVELQAIGAQGRAKLWSRNSVLRTLDRHTPEVLSELPFLPAELDERLDAVIMISANVPEGGPPNEEQRRRLPHLLQAVSRWHRSIHKRGLRYVEVGLPFRGEFALGKIQPEDAINMFWSCLIIDSASIRQRAFRLYQEFAKSPRISLECDRGTKLEMTLDLDHFVISDGVISAEDIEAGRTFETLPAGCLSFIPLPQGVTGVLCADYTFLRGRHYRNPRLEIRDGRIVELEVDDGADDLRDALASAAGDANLIAEIAFGLNASGRGPTGKTLLDGCLDGTVTTLFGNNELLGGEVCSTINLILPSCRMNVQARDRLLIERGEFVA